MEIFGETLKTVFLQLTVIVEENESRKGIINFHLFYRGKKVSKREYELIGYLNINRKLELTCI